MKPRPAAEEDLLNLWETVGPSRIFRSQQDFFRFHREGEWRVIKDAFGGVVIVDNWREHLNILAILGVWGGNAHFRGLVKAAYSTARAMGYAQILSPPVPKSLAKDYESLGMNVRETMLVIEFDADEAEQCASELPSGILIRPAVAEDIPTILRLDHRCFEPFWAYDIPKLVSALVGQRFMVGEEDGVIIGYTLSTLECGSGSIGRIAVEPESRRKGVGSVLFRDAVSFLRRAGVDTVHLCTQAENAPSRALYSRFRGVEMNGKLLLMVGPA
ncbi:MAG: GNAT family N-acetyltransferase [Actinobacteria bacterium]|nr:GNAT family N-acetyltransferase [Actinomycetota bacterium]